MQNTCCRKKLIHTLVALATLLVAHALLPQLVQAQYDPKEEDIIWERELSNGDEVLSSHFIDSERLLVANRDKAEIRSTIDGSLLESAPSSHVAGFAPSQSRTKFVAFNRDSVYVWDIETLTIQTVIPIPDSYVFKVAISESGKYVGVMGSAGLAGMSVQYTIWDTETMEQVYFYEKDNTVSVDMAFSGDTLAALSEIGTHLYDLRTREKTIVVSGGSLKFSPDGKWLVRGKYNQNAPLQIDIVNVQEKQLAQTYDDFLHQSLDIESIIFSPDGTQLYIRISARLYLFTFPSMEPQGIFQYVGQCDVSPDGKKVATPLYMLTLENITSVNDTSTDGVFSVAPHPVTEQAIISLPSQGTKHTEVQLITLEGEMVGTIFNGVIPEQMTILFSLNEHPHLASGQYFLQMIVDGQPQETLPFIIQR